VPDATLPSDIHNAIADRGVDRELVTLLDSVAGQAPVVIASSGTGPLGLAAAADAGVAAYVRRHSVSIALDAAEAQRLHARHGWRLESKANQATSYIQINSDDLVRPGLLELVSETLVGAFERSLAGPRGRPAQPSRPVRARSTAAPATPRRAATAPQRGEMCEIHFMERSVDGTCPMCED
jgi:hypothetical protein